MILRSIVNRSVRPIPRIRYQRRRLPNQERSLFLSSARKSRPPSWEENLSRRGFVPRGSPAREYSFPLWDPPTPPTKDLLQNQLNSVPVWDWLLCMGMRLFTPSLPSFFPWRMLLLNCWHLGQNCASMLIRSVIELTGGCCSLHPSSSFFLPIVQQDRCIRWNNTYLSVLIVCIWKQALLGLSLHNKYQLN